MPKDTFQKMSKILRNRKMWTKTKIRMPHSYVYSIVTYDSDCSTVTAMAEKELKALDMWLYRRMLNMPWTDRVMNEQVLRRAKQI